MPIPEDKLKAIREALFAGRKIDAIKIYREQTRSNLVDAKAAIDDLDAEMRLLTPEKFGEPARGAGCQGVLMLIVGLAALAAVWWLVR